MKSLTKEEIDARWDAYCQVRDGLYNYASDPNTATPVEIEQRHILMDSLERQGMRWRDEALRRLRTRQLREEVQKMSDAVKKKWGKPNVQ